MLQLICASYNILLNDQLRVNEYELIKELIYYNMFNFGDENIIKFSLKN